MRNVERGLGRWTRRRRNDSVVETVETIEAVTVDSFAWHVVGTRGELMTGARPEGY